MIQSVVYMFLPPVGSPMQHVELLDRQYNIYFNTLWLDSTFPITKVPFLESLSGEKIPGVRDEMEMLADEKGS